MPRDWSKPYTEDELENLKTLFQELPTYKPGGWVKASDIPKMIEFMEYPRTPEQIAGYVEHWEQHCGGIVTMEQFITSASVVHSTVEFARDYATKFDYNGDGIISKEEFMALVKVISSHDPKLSGKTYDDFLKEADSNKDGHVSIDECANWIESYCKSE